MAHHGRAVTRVPDLPAAVINVYLEVDIALWPASSLFGQLHVVGPAVGHMGVALGQLSISASSRITHGPARCGRRGTRPGRAPRWAGASSCSQVVPERPGSVNSQLPEGHHPAKPDSLRPCRVRQRFFAFSKESRPDRRVSGWPEPVRFRTGGRRAGAKRATERFSRAYIDV